MTTKLQTLVRHEGEAPRERSTCGWRDRLISREDCDVAAWVHAVDIDGAREHYHKRGTELYYVLDGEGTIVLDGEDDSNIQAMRTIVVPKPVVWLIAAVFILLFIVLPGFFILYGVRQVIVGNASKTWPTAEGKVISSSVESHKTTTHRRRGRRSTTTAFRAEVHYQFTVSGQTYSSNRVSFGDYGSSDPSHARSVANKYPAGSSITVYHSPSSPETSVLEPGVTLSTFLWLVLGVPFACVGVAGIVVLRMGPRWLAQKRDRRDRNSLGFH